MFASFVMPVYDRTSELKQAIESIMGQSCSDWELIIVTDGSPKDTLSIIDLYRKCANVRIFDYRSASGNATRGRNRGILEARGEYILFLDSDDFSYPTRVDFTRNAASKYNADVIAGCALFLNNGRVGEKLPVSFSRSEALPLSEGLLLRLNPFITSCVAVRRDVLLRYGGFRPAMRYREDHELWLRLYHRKCSFLHLPEPLGIYRLHPGNLELTYINNTDYWLRCLKTEYLIPFNDWGVTEGAS
jgi:O-antigen biosynthesis protein